jgi:4-hydroxy-tetrahydrodipicolinate synthase
MQNIKLDEAAKGVYVIATTPFTETGNVDYESIDSLADFYLASGVHGMTVLVSWARPRN